MTVPVVYHCASETHHFVFLRSWLQTLPGRDGELDPPAEKAQRDGWFQVPIDANFRAITVWCTEPVGFERYELRDPEAQSVKFPAALSVSEYQRRTIGFDEDEAPEYALYRPVRAEPKRTLHELGNAEHHGMVTIMEIDSPPPPRDGRTWVARLPFELEHHPEVLHLFPGNLINFRKAAADRLNELPGVKAYDNATFSVFRTLTYDPPKPLTAKQRKDRKGHVPKDAQQTRTVSFDNLKVPDRIPGATRAAACEVWETEMARIIDAVYGDGAVKACSVCDGTGIIRPEQKGT